MLEINVQEKEIGGRKYFARPMPPQMSLALMGDLQAVITTSAGSKEDGSVDISFGTLICGVGRNLNGTTLVGFADRILNKTYVSVEIETNRGTDVVQLDKSMQEELFTGHVELMLQVMWFVLEVNYQGFFDWGQSLLGIPVLSDLKATSPAISQMK